MGRFNERGNCFAKKQLTSWPAALFSASIVAWWTHTAPLTIKIKAIRHRVCTATAVAAFELLLEIRCLPNLIWKRAANEVASVHSGATSKDALNGHCKLSVFDFYPCKVTHKNFEIPH